jgi:23S rRNA (pseudouridine1915-N3)-methyltransferase
MKLIVAAVGKPRHAALAAAIEDYETRAARYWPLDVREVREGSRSGRGSDDATVRETEGQRLAEKVGPATLVVCDERGASMTSPKFARFLQDARERARDVAFVIGGAHGLVDWLRERAQTQLSLAPWTLPHELARLVLAEQLYRAGTIVRGEPYHK